MGERDLTETIRERYNRTAMYYDWMDRMIPERLRKKTIEQASGDVLEIGVGTGSNLPFYREGCRVTCIDFSQGMLAKAKNRVHLTKVPVTLLEMDAQHLSFADNTFDTVVATCVFCSVPDPVQGLREARRVCKPEGKIVLLEHVRSDNPVLGWLMDTLNPVFLFLIGSNINRRTVENVKKAGISIEKVENVAGKIVKLILATA
ncbi:MAG TPA: methyltransferase domain-containing protein [Selenomonadales bacterium]|nr:methyltransferase domain-containing protein [Selenomonadales bacterium]